MLCRRTTGQLDFVQKWIQRGWEGGSKYGMVTNRSMISDVSVALITDKLGSYPLALVC